MPWTRQEPTSWLPLDACRLLLPDGLEPAKDKEERRRTGQRLREATRARGWRQQDPAGMLEVHRRVVAHVMAGDYRVPPAWMPDLNRLFGENWMSE